MGDFSKYGLLISDAHVKRMGRFVLSLWQTVK